VPDKRNSADELEAFAKRIDAMIRKGKDRTSIALLICRHMTGEDAKVAAMLLTKWVSWRYGDPKQRHEHTGEGGGPLQHVVHTIRFGDGNRDS
jgi:hypothetical protein